MTAALPDLKALHIGVVGLGYVGLPLALEFGRHYTTVGFDIDPLRVTELQNGIDRTREATREALQTARRLRYCADPAALIECNGFIVTVPTPVDHLHQPDLKPLQHASETVGACLKPGDLVIYESTVYPGTTEEVCVPILERVSGLRFNRDFYCGYSPERISPGDRQHRLSDIKKVTSGSTPEAAALVDALYASIVTAGTWQAPSIRVAEAAKVVENIQRDVNIALMNELALIFERLEIDTLDVLEAAGTKWNFLPFRPGLVGGHCIGVDPYYLLHKSKSVGYHPELIHTARAVNDRVVAHVVERVIALLEKRGRTIEQASVLILGVTFKENCPDLRNSRALDLVRALQARRAQVQVFDPWVDPDTVELRDIELLQGLGAVRYDAVILTVAHEPFRHFLASEIRALCAPDGVIYDVKSIWPRAVVDERL